MRRSRRRLWTFGLTSVAVLLIVAALAVGVFRVMVIAAPSYRGNVQNWLSELLGQPVTIGSMDLAWHRWRPAVEFERVALQQQESASTGLAADALRVELSLRGLLMGELRIARIDVQQPGIRLRRRADGGWDLVGLLVRADSDAEAPAPQALLEQIKRLGTLAVSGARVEIQGLRPDAARPDLVIDPLDVTLRVSGGRLRVNARGIPADTAGERVELTARLDPRGNTWDAFFQARATAFDAAYWLQPLLAKGYSIPQGSFDLAVDGRLLEQRLDAARIQAAVSGVAIENSSGRHVLGRAALDAQLSQTETGWTAEINQLDLLGSDGEWPTSSGRLEVTLDPEAEHPIRSLQADASFLRLQDLVPLIHAFRPESEATAEAVPLLPAARGDLRGVVFRGYAAEADSVARHSITARFSDLGVRAGESHPGFTGLDGALFSDERGGRMELSAAGATFDASNLFAAPLPVDSASGHLRWLRHDEGWRLYLEQLRYSLLSVEGDGQMQLDLKAGESPVIDLKSQFTASDVARLKPLVLQKWKPKLRNWVGSALPEGRIARGELTLKGRLKDYPFDKGNGEFRLDAAVAGATLIYAPDWPPIRNIAADFQMLGKGLSVNAWRGDIVGNSIKSARGTIENLREPYLFIAAETTGDASSLLSYLRASPLQPKLAGFLDVVEGKGPIVTSLNISRPMRGKHPLRVIADADLQAVELTYSGLPDDPFRNLTGRVHLDGNRIEASGLKADFRDAQLVAEIRPPENGRPYSLLRATTEAGFGAMVGASAEPAAARVHDFVPEWLRSKIDGRTAATLELQFGDGARSGVRIASDLAGLAIRKPPPLGKPASLQRETEMWFMPADDSGMTYTMTHADILGLRIDFERIKNGLRARSSAVHFGTEIPPPMTSRGMRITGLVEDLHVSEWVDLIQGIPRAENGWGFPSVDLTVRRLHALRQQFVDIEMSLIDRERWVDVNLDGAGAKGVLRWPYPEEGRALIEADLDYLRWPSPNVREDTTAVPRDALDPATLPGFRVNCREFDVGGERFGALQMLVLPEADGLRMESMTIGGAALDAKASGLWVRRNGLSSGSLDLSLSSSNIERVIRAMNYQPNLKASTSDIQASLLWPERAEGIAWNRAEGNLSIDFRDGALVNIDPGAGRMLGLFSFNALPRRFLLDFRDLTDEGMSFDRMHGKFRLADGSAYTDDLKLESPSIKMDASGRIGLVARDYDQKITLYPDASTGLTLAGALLGGPAVGAFLMLAQELLDKPMDQASQISYRLTGSWDKPEIR